MNALLSCFRIRRALGLGVYVDANAVGDSTLRYALLDAQTRNVVASGDVSVPDISAATIAGAVVRLAERLGVAPEQCALGLGLCDGVTTSYEHPFTGIPARELPEAVRLQLDTVVMLSDHWHAYRPLDDEAGTVRVMYLRADDGQALLAALAAQRWQPSCVLADLAATECARGALGLLPPTWNLLPERQRPGRLDWLPMAACALGVLAVATAVFAALTWHESREVASELARAQLEWQAVEPQYATMTDLVAQRRANQARRDLVAQLSKSPRVPLTALLDVLGATTVDGLWFSEIKAEATENGGVRLTGVADDLAAIERWLTIMSRRKQDFGVAVQLEKQERREDGRVAVFVLLTLV